MRSRSPLTPRPTCPSAGVGSAGLRCRPTATPAPTATGEPTPSCAWGRCWRCRRTPNSICSPNRAAPSPAALRDYGAYVVDDAAQPVANIAVEHSPDGRLRGPVRQRVGFRLRRRHHRHRQPQCRHRQRKPRGRIWKADLDQLFGALVVVADNAADSVGGAGPRRACFAPPFTGPDARPQPRRKQPQPPNRAAAPGAAGLRRTRHGGLR